MRPHSLLGVAVLGLSLSGAGLAWAQPAAPAPATTPKNAAPTKSKTQAAPKPPVAKAPVAKAKSEPTPAVAAAEPKKVSKGEAQALQWFNMLDADGDGRVSRKEAELGFRLRPSLKKDFEDADLNHDGYLAQNEIRTVAERRRVERQARRERERAAEARQAGNSSVK